MRRGVLLGLWLVGAAVPLSAQVPAQPPPKPAAPKPAAPKPAAPKPVPVPAGQRCTFQIDNVDRQGAVTETPAGTNYFAGGNVQLSCRGTQISMASDSVAAYAGNVIQFIGHVKYRDSTLTMDADLLQERRALGSARQRRHQEPQYRLDADGPGAGLLPRGERCPRHDRDVCYRPSDHPLR